jgi:hypothetical protein
VYDGTKTRMNKAMLEITCSFSDPDCLEILASSETEILPRPDDTAKILARSMAFDCETAVSAAPIEFRLDR